jgi:hypothetical protein
LLVFLWNSFVLKMYFRKLIKKKKNLSYRIGPSPWARPNLLRPSRLARRGPPSFRPEAKSATPPPPGGVRAGPGHAPIMARPRDPRASPSPARRREPDAVARASLDAAARPSSPALTSDFRPPPFISVAGEHTFAIPLIHLLSPFCISPKPLTARNSVDLMRQGKFLYVRSSCPCSCLEVEDKVALRIGPYPFL